MVVFLVRICYIQYSSIFGGGVFSMKRLFILIFLLVPVLFCSAIEIVSGLPGNDWMETPSQDTVIKKAYIVKPDRKDISVMVMSEQMPKKEMSIENIIDNYKMGLMSNDLFKDGNYSRKLNVKIGGNTWGLLQFRKEFDKFSIFHDSYVTVIGNTVVYVTFFTLNEDDYNKYLPDVKAFLEMLKLNE
jgi:hypothetical protein